MITGSLIDRIFSAASIERWNEYPRPAVFTELGKQAHKMAIAWVLARSREGQGEAVDWTALVECGILEFLHRVVVTDIRLPVFDWLMEDAEVKARLDDWVCKALERDLSALAAPLCPRQPEREKNTLRTAHYLATRWEFGFIYKWAGGVVYGIEDTKRDIEAAGVEKTQGIAREMLSPSPGSEAAGLWGFISMFGQLAFQKRWAQTPRVPPTSVLGHAMFVAVVSYLLALEVEAGAGVAVDAFFGGLFHDLPEVLTRDIASPIKTSVDGLDSLIHRYERDGMERNVLPLLPEAWRGQLRKYTESFRWPGGEIVEFCDKLAAYVEASESIRMGLHPRVLEDARRGL
ncbi:MAG: HD domain-containing protein, partial [Synergistaceae bacterium]|nr:HD domain-containing protein [Synergistaceae bacterium]